MSASFWNGILRDHADANTIADRVTKAVTPNDAARAAVEAFNSNPDRPFDTVYGERVYHRARLPILATDCDYEIVTVSGVQGRRLGQ